ncbi:hypothetical protein N7488_000192 [Penicillium malachiteum]|nr:hypothetical protein N7488_000192 [Penicillium malachiteum]
MAIDSRDPDGDSEMASSIDSASDTAGHGTRTPTNPQASAAVASELSPPGSQPQHISDNTNQSLDDIAPVPTEIAADASEQPIGSWRSKRAQEEYQRAMENVIHKDFNLNEFGDPFDERDTNEPLA